MSPFHWWLIYAGWQVMFSIGLVGCVSAAFYWRWKYEDISERMNLACRMIQHDRDADDILKVLEEH